MCICSSVMSNCLFVHLERHDFSNTRPGPVAKNVTLWLPAWKTQSYTFRNRSWRGLKNVLTLENFPAQQCYKLNCWSNVNGTTFFKVSVHLPVYVSVYLSISLTVCLSVYLSVYQSVYKIWEILFFPNQKRSFWRKASDIQVSNYRFVCHGTWNFKLHFCLSNES